MDVGRPMTPNADSVPDDCPACDGDGYLSEGFGPPCSRCKGTGATERPNAESVRCPSECFHGNVLEFDEYGENIVGSRPCRRCRPLPTHIDGSEAHDG